MANQIKSLTSNPRRKVFEHEKGQKFNYLESHLCGWYV